MLGYRPTEGLLGALACQRSLPYVGPQPLGSLLAEMVLRPLDQWGSLQEELYQSQKRRRQSTNYSRLVRVRTYLSRYSLEVIPPIYRNGRPVASDLVGLTIAEVVSTMASGPSYDLKDEHFSRLTYLRHGSTLLLGLAGDRQRALELRKQLGDILEKLGLGAPIVTLEH